MGYDKTCETGKTFNLLFNSLIFSLNISVDIMKCFAYVYNIYHINTQCIAASSVQNGFEL